MAEVALSLAEVGLLAGLLLLFQTAGTKISEAILRAAERHLEGSRERPIPQLERLEAWAVALRELEAKVDRLPSVWEDWDEKQNAREQRITKRIAKARRDGIAVDEGSVVPDPTGPDDSQPVRGVPGEEGAADGVDSEDDLAMTIFQQRMFR